MVPEPLTPFELFLDVITIAMQGPVMAYFTGKAIKTERLKLCVFLYTALSTANYVIFRTLPQIQWITLLLLTLSCFIAFSKVSKLYTVFYYVTGIVLMMLFETGIEIAEKILIPELGPSLQTDPIMISILRLVIQPLLIIVWYLNTRIWNKFFHLGESKEFDRYIPFIIVEAASLYVMFLNITSTELEKRLYPEILLTIAIAAFLIIDILLIHVFSRMDVLHKKEMQERTSNEILQVQMENYQYQYRRIREFRKIRHDLVNHLQTIELFLDNKENEKARELLRYYGGEIKLSGQSNITGNDFADMIISKKMERTEKEGISFVINGSLANDLSMNPASLCSLIENILDNAINGCLQSQKEQTSIEFKVAADQNKLMLRCTNTCSVDSVKPSGSARENGDHGWGTQIIESIASKYGGDADYQIHNGTFITTVYCFLNQEPKDYTNA